MVARAAFAWRAGRLREPAIGGEVLLDLREHAFDALIQATRAMAGAPASQGR